MKTIRFALLPIPVCLLVLAVGCGKDLPSDFEPEPEESCPDKTELITEALPYVYATMDSAGYAAILDPAYRFVPLDSEVDPDDPNPWWDRDRELTIAGRMFNARYNDAGQRVERIQIELTERTMVVDHTPYPGKPEGETWYQVRAFVDLLVVVEDPSDEEGVVNFIVLSDQIFVVRPDPAREGCWLIYRQIDQELTNKSVAMQVSGTGETSWGFVKSLFLCSSPAAFVTGEFERVYAAMDSTGYATLLDPAYRFELLDSEVDPDNPSPWWDLVTELQIAGRMFHARYNENGQRVERIEIGLREDTTVVDNTAYPEKPEGETWYQVKTSVDLLVVVEDPDDVDGVINFHVLSPEYFTVRPDPNPGCCWLIYKQEDLEPFNKVGAMSDWGTTQDSWGSVKNLFR